MHHSDSKALFTFSGPFSDLTLTFVVLHKFSQHFLQFHFKLSFQSRQCHFSLINLLHNKPDSILFISSQNTVNAIFFIFIPSLISCPGISLVNCLETQSSDTVNPLREITQSTFMFGQDETWNKWNILRYMFQILRSEHDCILDIFLKNSYKLRICWCMLGMQYLFKKNIS